MNIDYLNPFSKKFLKLTNNNEANVKQIKTNSQGIGEDDEPRIGDYYFGDNAGGYSESSQISFNQYFDNKRARISKYREMASYPEISIALDMVCDEAVAFTSNGESFEFLIEKTSDIKRSDIRFLRNEFNRVVDELFNFKDVGWDLFWKFIVDGELFLEVILNTKGNQIIGFKPLPAYEMVPIYEGGEITKFSQINPNKTVFFEKNQMLYISFGKYGINKQDVRGYLDPSIKIYNQLRNLEDSVVIYRLVRAPERRIWNIEVGQAPTGKAEEIVKQTMQRYKKNLNYDSESGLIDSSNNFQALTEDFWFARKDGAGSSVDVLQGGQQLGELSDVNYFLMKLYKSLKIPPTRWGGEIGQTGTQYTNTKDIEREELNFTKFVERLQKRFTRLIESAFLMSLQVQGADPKLIDRSRYKIKMIMNNHFRQYRDLELIREKLDVINNYSDLVVRKDNEHGVLSNDFFMKYIVNLPGNLMHINKQMLEIEKEQIENDGGFVDPNAVDEF